jgi:aspartate/methionine/tyrosine aminotransferase
MKVRKTGAKYSSIVSIGEEIKKLENETGEEYLKLNRGVNSVVNMNLENVISLIDFNDTKIQIYPPNNGFIELRKAISVDYFENELEADNIFVVNGGMSGLDLIMKTLDVPKIYNSEFYWGAYKNIMKINKVEQGVYGAYETIYEHLDEYKGNALIICDPNNPIGNKYPDDELLELIKTLVNNETIVIIDSPYRKLFIEDNFFYKELLKLENVIINESFSKRMGLSGQRIGFVHSKDKVFNYQLNTHILFATNGINAFSQILIEKLLTTKEGVLCSDNFRIETTKHINKNVKWLKDNNLLADEFYKDGSIPMGIFVVVKPSQETLTRNRIGSVSLHYFTSNQDIIDKNYSRICVSVNHNKFIKYFKKLI